ncbi:MAG TPA: hypothetical protein PLV42_05530 [bacterium]|nr:hypothetical protein [bacterium]
MSEHKEFRPFVTRRYLAAVYERIPVPAELTTEEEMAAFARGATLGRFKCVLAPGPGRAIWFNEKGEITGRDEHDAQLPRAKPDVGRLIF